LTICPSPELRTCECCNLDKEVWVCSSSLGPLSLAFCRECLDHKAEPEWLFRMTLDDVGADYIAPWVRQLSTFKDGQYLSWQEWLNLIKEHTHDRGNH
jgi:hypothetical protein